MRIKKWVIVVMLLGIVAGMFLGKYQTTDYQKAINQMTKISIEDVPGLMASGKTSFLYIGRESCPHCVTYAPMLAKAGAQTKTVIYYLEDVTDNELKGFRDANGITSVPAFVTLDGEGAHLQANYGSVQGIVDQLNNLKAPVNP